MIVNANKNDVAHYTSQADKVTVLFFSTPTCMKCKILLNSINESIKAMYGEDADKVVVLKIDGTKEIDLAIEYLINSVPAVVVIRDGKASAHLDNPDIVKVMQDIVSFAK